MATGSLGTLSIDVLANIAGMVSDLGKAQAEATKATREIQRQFQEMGDGIGESLRGIAELVGIAFSLDKIKEFGQAAFEQAEKVNHLAQSLGVSTQTIQAFSYAAGVTGGTLDDVGGALAKLEKASVGAASGNAQLAAAFKAIGVEVTDSSGKLKPAESLITETAKALSGFQDGATKTAIAMVLLGRGAAQNIPFLNELGKNFDELKQKALEAGIVLSDADQKALVGFDEEVNKLGQSVKGLGNQFAVVLAPALTEIVEKIQAFISSSDFKSTLQAIGDGAKYVADHLGEIATAFKIIIEVGFAKVLIDMTAKLYEFGVAAATAKTSLLSIQAAVGVVGAAIAGWNIGTYLRENFLEAQQAGVAFVNAILVGWERIKEGAEIAFATVKSVMAEVYKQAQEAKIGLDLGLHLIGLDEAKKQIDALSGSSETLATKIAAIKAESDKAVFGINDITDSMMKDAAASFNTAKATTAIGEAVDSVNKKLPKLPENLGAIKKATDEWLKSEQSALDFLDKLSEALGGPYQQAWQKHSDDIDKANHLYEELITKGHSLAEAEAFLANAVALADQKFDEQTDKIIKQTDWLGQIAQKYDDEIRLLKATGTAHDVVTAIIEAENKARSEYEQHLRDSPELTQGEIDAVTRLAAAKSLEKQAVEASNAAIKEWQSIATSGFDSVGKSIADFATGGIKNWHDFGQSLIGDAKQFIAAIIEEFLKLEVFNGIINQLFGSNLPTGLGGLASLGGGGAGGGIGGLSNLSSLGSLFSGSGGLSSLWSGVAGGGSGSSFLGGATYGTDASTGFMTGSSYAPSMLGNIIGIGGGILAGINEFKAAGGGLGGLAGGAAYGLGTLTATGAVGGVLSGAGAAAGASGALGAVGLGAIPVVGWVALAAMALNAITGGGLFGTSAKPIGSEENLSVGQNGASISAAIDEKGKKALFGGSYWKAVSAPVDQTTQDSVAAFFTGLQNAATAEAKSFGESTANIVTGSFHETFDKAGKMLTQTSTVLGQTYSESIQDFQNRVLADTLAAQIPAAAGAVQIAQQWQSSATALLAGVEFLAQAQLDIQQGHALVQGDTLATLTKFVQGMAQQGESLLQTYARLSAETTTVQTILGNLGLDTGKTGEALVKFDDDMVNAAGGLQNLTNAWQTYYSEYYSQSEQQANSLKAIQSSVASLFAGIGEDPTESMAKFRADFESLLPSLSAGDIVKWLQAGDALAKLNQAMGTTAQQTQAAADAAATQAQAQADALTKYNAYIAGFTAIINPMTQFETAIAGVGKSLTDSIAQANQLAIAAGQSSASIGDLGTIIQASAIQGAAALQTLESDAQNLAGKLFGTSLDALKANLAAAQGKAADNGPFQYYWTQQANQLQEQVDAAEAQQQAAQHLQDATALLQDLGQIGTVSGQSLQDLATQLGIPLDKLAQYLGTDQTGVQKQFEQIEATARAAIDTAGNTKYTNELLADILAQYKGEALPFAGNPIQTAITGVSPAAGGKIGGPITVGPPAHADLVATQQPAVDAINTNTSQSNSDMNINNRLLTEQNDLLRQMLQKIGYGGTSVGPRSIRTGVLIP